MIIVNFKNYLHGEKALTLAKKIEKYLPDAIVSPSSVDLSNIAKNTRLKIYAQHSDTFRHRQKSTGWITSDSIRFADCKGSLLNHSEHQIKKELVWAIKSDLDENKLKAVLCVPTLSAARKFLKLKPYAMAFEDLNLIATGKSITSYRSEGVRKFVNLLRGTGIVPLCGAGICSAEDVKEAYNLGCKGVIIASAIADSKNPEKLLKEIAEI